MVRALGAPAAAAAAGVVGAARQDLCHQLDLLNELLLLLEGYGVYWRQQMCRCQRQFCAQGWRPHSKMKHVLEVAGVVG